MDHDVWLEEIVEGVEVARIAGRQPLEDDCLARIGHDMIFPGFKPSSNRAMW